MSNTTIEWTEKTWNPVTGCSTISSGCKNCYAKTMAKRLKAMGVKKYKNNFTLTLHPECLEEPFKWKKPAVIFVCSMSDLFHEAVPYEFIDSVINIIEHTPQHTYQILTKRSENMKDYFCTRRVPKNVWLGVTVESKEYKDRINDLREVKSKIKFLSLEPLLGDLGALDLRNIDWIIVGGESGVKGRPMKKEWVIPILIQAKKNNIAFFFKQWGKWGADGVKRSKKANGKLINGKVYQEMPKK